MVCRLHIDDLVIGMVKRILKFRLYCSFATLIGGKDEIVGIGQWLTCFQNLGYGNASPFGNARPALNAVMLSDLCLFCHGTQVCKREMQWFFNQATYLKLPVYKIISRQLLILL